jgi:hypothetical protein
MPKTKLIKDLTEKQIKVINANAAKIEIAQLSELSGATINCIRMYCKKYQLVLKSLENEIKLRESWEGEDGIFNIDGWAKEFNKLFAIS